MSGDVQTDLFGGETPVEELDWGPAMRRVAELERAAGIRLAADEAGAVVHELRGKHAADERCLYCARDGRDLLDRLHPPRAAEPPRARGSDPATSHAAAGSVQGLRDRQQAILRLFRELGPMSDDLLLERYQAAEQEGNVPRQSPSGVRTRRHELVELGLLDDTGRRVQLPSGRWAIVWDLRDSGEAAA